MSISKPYRRNCRQFQDGSYANGGKLRYVQHPSYAKNPDQYIHAFLLIQKDLQTLFDYIHPSDVNLLSYSFRVHELLARTCMEVEANCKAIMEENGYVKDRADMKDYSKLEITHKLSSYKVKVPYWRGMHGTRIPFSNWAGQSRSSLDWYDAYNKTKHNRQAGFERANLENLIDSVCGLFVILSSQFYIEDFSTGADFISLGGYSPHDGMQPGIGNYFRIKFPDWQPEERYSFTYEEWLAMENQELPFQCLNFM